MVVCQWMFSIDRFRDWQCEKFEQKLLTRKIRLWDVPESLRRDPMRARGIYIIGFRADRMVSKERYEEDLLKLAVEISMVEAMGNQPELVPQLQGILADMQSNLFLFDIYKITDFH